MKEIITPKNTNNKKTNTNKAMTAVLGVLMVLPNTGFTKEKTQENIKNIFTTEKGQSTTEQTVENIFDIQDFEQKIPPKLKDVYKKLLKINSKQNVKNIALTGSELEIFLNLFGQYSQSALGNKVTDNFKDIFNAQGNLSVYVENFSGLKLLVISMGGQELFAINYTVASNEYTTWTLQGTPIVIDRTYDKCFVRDIEGNKLEGWFSIMPDGNLLPITENGEYNKQTFLFWDVSFHKGTNEKFSINTVNSPNTMLEYVYQKKKEKIGRMKEIKSMENMGYVLDRDDKNRTVRVKKDNIKSQYSESILIYKTDKDFLKWTEDGKKTVDSGVVEIQKKEAKFEDFYNKYFNDNATYKENERYKIVREGPIKFYLLDTENRDKILNKNPISIFDERDRLLTNKDIDALIEKYEVEQIYFKFIAKNNTKDVINNKGEHMENNYYVGGYPFEYKGFSITLERTPFTDWKYAILVKDNTTQTFKGKIALDNTMSASEIERQIDKVIK